jgi:hypothetical protein
VIILNCICDKCEPGKKLMLCAVLDRPEDNLAELLDGLRGQGWHVETPGPRSDQAVLTCPSCAEPAPESPCAAQTPPK